MADQRPLIESSDLGETANNTPVLSQPGFASNSHSLGPKAQPNISLPSSPTTSRLAYTRNQGDATAVERNTPSTVVEEDGEDEEDVVDGFRRHSMSGLGIASLESSHTARRVSIQTIPRGAVSTRSPSIISPNLLSPPNTGDPLFGGFPTDSPASTPDLGRERFSPRDSGGGHQDFRRGRRIEPSLKSVDEYEQYIRSSDRDRLRNGTASIKSAYETDFRPTHECPTSRDFYISRWSWISTTICILCLFSTVFSAIFLGLALKGHRYGRSITSQGSLKPEDAIVLTSIMAKLIELSFVTSFVSFLGQVLSRRAFMKEQGRGITLSELSMWRWVVQPGTLITHWETAKYSGLTILGILSLLSALLATLYAPAATALVQPMLKAGKWETRVMAAHVKTQFANINYIKDNCRTPITESIDPENGGNTCLQIEHAGQGYHNYQRYLAYWKTESDYGNGTTDQHKRPQGFGLLNENTTINAQWIDVIDTKQVSKQHNRAINNVSLAMPHAGVFQAARDQRNGILQPEELNSEGTYSLSASVPSLVMNVLCANMERDELKPIIYEEWNNEPVDISTWDANATTKNNTVVDDLFGWTKKNTENFTDYPPVFAKYPKEFNTIVNHTTGSYWGRDSIYLLGQGGVNKDGNQSSIFVLCKMHASITPGCSTHYTAMGGGGVMEAHCEDPADELAYIKSNTSTTEVTSVPDWRIIGLDWANSLSLNSGIVDGNASNARLLTQLILKKQEGEYDLDKALPSPAEALAVMSGCTLLKSSMDGPYVTFWNYSEHALVEPATQWFNASVKAQQYASGGVDGASKAWMIILVLVFLMNIFVLTYFVFHHGLVTDFTEPPNLFALAVNSPPSHLLAGSCGGGPTGKQYSVNWFVNTEGGHLYVETGAKTPLGGHVHVHSGAHQPSTGVWGAIANGFHNLRQRGLHLGSSRNRARLYEDNLEMEDGHSRTQRQYAKLANRTSML